MLKGFLNIIILLTVTFVLPPYGFTEDIKDLRDLKERLIRIEERMVTKDELKAEIKELRTEFKTEINAFRSELKDFMLWGFGVTFAGIFALISFVLWDRRTALAPAVRKGRELEEREEKIERALKEISLKDDNVREALRRVGLL
jgi:DNA repair exonuclease SbcCD ATPase subunit